MCFLEGVSWQMLANHFCNKFISRYNVEPPGLEFLSETQALREREGRGSINWPKVGTSFNVTGFDIEMKVQCGPTSSFNCKWSIEWDKVVGDERLELMCQLKCTSPVLLLAGIRRTGFQMVDCKICKKWWRKLPHRSFISIGWCTPQYFLFSSRVHSIWMNKDS